MEIQYQPMKKLQDKFQDCWNVKQKGLGIYQLNRELFVMQKSFTATGSNCFHNFSCSLKINTE